MRSLDYSTGKTFVDEMMESLEMILTNLIKAKQKASKLMENVASSSTLFEFHLSIVLFNENTCKCILFDQPFNQEKIQPTTTLIQSEVKDFLEHCSSASTGDMLSHVIQQVLNLHQHHKDEMVNSILLVTNSKLDMNFATLHPFILLLIQRDIPLHALLLMNNDVEEETMVNAFSSSNAQLLEKICHFTRGACWVPDLLPSALFMRTIDLSTSYLSQPSILSKPKYTCLDSKEYCEEYKSILLASTKFHVVIDPFLQHCISNGFELTNVYALSSTNSTFSFILPLTLSHHLKLVIYKVLLYSGFSIE